MDPEVLTVDTFIAYMKAFERRLKGRRNLITRKEIIADIGRYAYENAVKKGHLTPIKNGNRNAKVRVTLREYNALLEKMNK